MALAVRASLRDSGPLATSCPDRADIFASKVNAARTVAEHFASCDSSDISDGKLRQMGRCFSCENAVGVGFVRDDGWRW